MQIQNSCLAWAAVGVRSRLPKHMVFYRHWPEESAVLIVQVLYGARNLDIILSDEP